ncbi:Gfo/Idh/MocA family protein [Planctomycetota bacterium]
MINVAMAGCGYWGPNLVRNFISLGDCNVTKLCDVDPKRLSHLKSLYPAVETTEDFGEVVNDASIDAVVIATPVRFHFDMAKASLTAGKHTFVEKPMASSVTECEELVEIAEKKGLTLMVGHTFVYSAPVRKIKEIIEAGELGEIQYISSQRLNLGLFQKDINVAWDLAPHDISIILYIMKEPPVSVNCQGKAHVNENIEDVTNMTLNFANGGMAIIQSSWLDPNKVRKITVVGDKKMLVYDDLETTEKIKIYDTRVEIPPHYDTFAEFQYAYHYGDMHSPYIKMVEPLKVEAQHFLDCINSGEKSMSSGQDGLEVVQVLEASSKSLKVGGGEVAI